MAKSSTKTAPSLTDSSDMKVVWRNLSSIKPYPQNPKDHSEEAVVKLAAGIEAYGWNQPIVLDAKGVIIAGHRRYLAAKHLGLQKAPVFVARHLSEDQARAARLFDNRMAEDTPIDELLVAAEMSLLKAADFDLALTGYEAAEIQALSSGDDNASWLDDDTATSEDDPKKSQRSPSDLNNYVQITFVVTPAQRDLVVRTLKAEATKRDLPTAGSVLIQICQEMSQ